MKITIDYIKNYQEYLTALSQWSFNLLTKYNQPVTRKNQIEKFRQHCHIDRLPLSLIALNENEELIGMCSLVETESIRLELTPWLGPLYVTPSYRKQKIGTKLVDAAKRVAKSMSHDRLYLLAYEEELNNYYSRLGWSLIGREEVNHYPVSLMEISL